MDESGTRYPILRAPILERSVNAQTKPEKIAYGALTVLFWAFWIYLWVPLLALLAWALGIQQAYRYMVELGGYIELVRLLGMYLIVILLLGGALLLWAGYNIFRFGGIERRKPYPPITADDIAAGYRVAPADVLVWHKARRLTVSHDDVGAIESVTMEAATSNPA